MRTTWPLVGTLLAIACAGHAPPSTTPVEPVAPPEPAVAIGDGLPEEIAPLPISPGPVPQPPETNAPWSIPEGTPAGLATLALAAIEAGLPDPRGCEYRAVAIHVGLDAWSGDGGIVRTRGWVLPADGSSARWVIAHNGMLYAVAALGDRINLDQAVAEDRTARATIPVAPDEFEAREADAQRSCRRYSVHGADHEQWSVGCRFDALAAVQLIRLGRGDLAVWNGRWTPDGVLLGWAFDARVRGIGAHMRGDDHAALHALRIAARARDTGRTIRPVPASARGESDEFEIVDQLLRDQTRRVNAPRPDIPSLIAMGSTPAQAAALVAALDEMRPPQGGQPGWLMYEADPIFRALTMNEHAVPLLIDAVEHDDRFTRGVWAWRDFVMHRDAIPVQSAAQSAAMTILGLEQLWPEGRSGSPSEIAARLRAFARSAPTAAQRHLRTLRDPRAGLEAWAHAAEALDEPVDPASLESFDDRWVPATKRATSRRGDALRARWESTVNRLLRTRLRAAVRLAGWNATDPCTLASTLVGWTSRPETELRELHEACTDTSVRCTCFAGLTVALVELGDSEALQRYARALRRSNPDYGLPYDALQPILRSPTDQNALEVADWLAEHMRRADELTAQVDWPVLQVAPLALAVREMLDDRTRVGRLIVLIGAFRVEMIESQLYQTTQTSATDLPTPGTTTIVRRCDRAAAQLADHETPFELYWPEPRRDAAIAAIRARLPAP